jgi:2-polyprenyl-3-methyl-5-hydroxy-6-metoxy-1,4-benzoquinol methylase
MKTLGAHWTFNLTEDPKRLGFVLSRYRAAAALAGVGDVICEVGCSEGIGAAMLKMDHRSYVGLDLDEEAIAAAQRNFSNKDGFDFLVRDIVATPTTWKANSVVSLDVIEHIDQPHESQFMSALKGLCQKDGMLVVGTPSIYAQDYQSAASAIGHVNLFSPDRLRQLVGQYFFRVFMLGMNDETLHAGDINYAHYLLAVGIGPKENH